MDASSFAVDPGRVHPVAPVAAMPIPAHFSRQASRIVQKLLERNRFYLGWSGWTTRF
jgi:hypothetical protein